MLACLQHSNEIIKELRNNGAKYEIKDKNGLSSIHYAIESENYETVEFVLSDANDILDSDDSDLGN